MPCQSGDAPPHLADARVADEEQLEEEVVAVGHGVLGAGG